MTIHIYERSNTKSKARKEKIGKRKKNCRSHTIGLSLTRASPPRKAWFTTPICHCGSQRLVIRRHYTHYPLLVYK